MDIKPIETRYKGYKFRSRLEAKWAVFFDQLGIRYEYEPTGFILSNSSKYLPDFYLPDCKLYVEVKSIGAFEIEFEGDEVYFRNGREDPTKYALFTLEITEKNNYAIVFGDPLDVVMANHIGEGTGHLFLMGHCILRGSDMESNCGSCKTCQATFLCHYTIAGFVEGKPLVGVDSKYIRFLPALDGTVAVRLFCKDGSVLIGCEDQTADYGNLLKILKAAETAREERFEHRQKVGACNA